LGSIVVIGSANADLVVQVDRRPAGGETVLGSDLIITPGGKGANQAVAASLSGGDVRFVGRVGADPYGQMLRASLTGAGVDVSGLGSVASATGCALIFITPDGENSIVVAPGANGDVTPGYLRDREREWAGADVVVVQLEIPLDAVEFAADQCRSRGTRLVLNAAPASVLPASVLAVCDPLVVNESEAKILLGDPQESASDPESVARRLMRMGPHSVVITLGAAGAVAMGTDGIVHREPGRKVEAVDTTGAGDAFVGALATALAAGRPLAQGLVAATEVAALSVQRPGAQSSYPNLAEIHPE
jgi:ribokinase